jgi:Bacterial Ig-like domain/FlgD Ig-like domain/FG-GAP-like repeat
MRQVVSRSMRIIVVALAISPAAAFAAPPTVTSVYPLSQRISLSANTTISANFSEPINPATVTGGTFEVFGRWSGPAAGALSVVGATITFTPTVPFFAGEWITVNMTKGIQNMTGEGLAKGYAWNFWAKSDGGTLDLTYTGRVTCRHTGETWVQVYGAYAGDLNNDGFCDLSVPSEQTLDVRVFMNNGSGAYSTFVAKPVPSGQTPSPSEGADFNHDGQIDIVVGSIGNDKVSVMFGDGTGDFPTGTAYTAGQSVRGVGVADFNGDGWEDIVTANRFAASTTGNVSVFLNNGDGTFASPIFKESGASGEYSIGVADANNDGLLDVFCGTFNSPYYVIPMLSDGTGNLTPQTPVVCGGQPWQLTVGDFNGDGNVDVVVDNTNANRIGVLLGDGNGGLGAVQTFSTGAFPLAIDTGDIDGDGDLDLVSSNYSSGTWTIWENKLGTFVTPRTLPASSAGSCAVLFDRDRDGDLDMVGIDEVDDWLYIYDNQLPTTGVPATPRVVLDLENQPNPFNPSTSIRFDLGRPADITLKVYNASGAFVTTLVQGHQTAGDHEVHWDGTDARGRRVSSGVYFCRLTSGAVTETRKMVLLK